MEYVIHGIKCFVLAVLLTFLYEHLTWSVSQTSPRSGRTETATWVFTLFLFTVAVIVAADLFGRPR